MKFHIEISKSTSCDNMIKPPRELTVDQLYSQHHAAVRRFLARFLHCEDAAEEVTQEAFVRLLRFRPRQPVDNPRAYLFQVAANTARDWLARQNTRNRVFGDSEMPEDIRCPRPCPEACTLNHERLDLLSTAIRELPPRCREVFLMSRLDGLNNREIADRLGISRNMVEKHIIKAMLYCRRHLDMQDNY